jgi:GNAT superfamily N-acetyltransferase
VSHAAQELRIARTSDARGIVEVNRASWIAWSEQGLWPQGMADTLDADSAAQIWQTRLTRATERTWVWDHGGEIVGFARAAQSRDDDAAWSTGELQSIHVLPRLVATGLGLALWREAMSWFTLQRCDRVTVWTLRTNLRAQTFYSRAGFVPDGREREFHFQGEGIPELRYARELQP